MTIVSSAKRHILDVWKYLNSVLDRLLAGETDYTKLLPDVWKQEHPEAIRTYGGVSRVGDSNCSTPIEVKLRFWWVDFSINHS
jgi:hypothetical protein